ncbi:MAG: hypothetical protein RLZZ50_1166 [Verrucomicrobiota bacterium]|jgi:hypothetical protein
MFEISGTIKKLFDEQTFGSGFNKREFVLTIESGRFPQDIKFECVKDKIALLEGLEPGSKVKVFFDLRGREWKESYFVNLNAWKIEAEGAGESSAPAPRAKGAPATKGKKPAPAVDDDGAPLPDEPGETVQDEDVPF